MKSERFWQWHRNNLRMALAIVVLPVLLLAGSSHAQDIYIYPAKGQSHEQQDRDRYECHSWAVKQTGFDPSKAQAATSDTHAVSNQPLPPQGHVVQGRRARRRSRSGRWRDNRQCWHGCRRGRSDGRIGRRNAPATAKASAESAAAGQRSGGGQFKPKPAQRLPSRDGGVSHGPRLYR